jgi:hypothetical protein
MTRAADEQLQALRPKDLRGFAEFRRVVGTALRVMVGGGLPTEKEIEVTQPRETLTWPDSVTVQKLMLGRKGEQIPTLQIRGPEFDGTVVVWIHPAGKASLVSAGKLIPAARLVLERKAAILAPDVFMTGEFGSAKTQAVDRRFAGFTFGYNRPLLANRVRDILTAIASAKNMKDVKQVHLVGFEEAGPWALLARALCGDVVKNTFIDCNQFRFENVHATNDAMMLPGALKYGGLPVFAALCLPGDLSVCDYAEDNFTSWIMSAFEALIGGNVGGSVEQLPEKIDARRIIELLVR